MFAVVQAVAPAASPSAVHNPTLTRCVPQVLGERSPRCARRCAGATARTTADAAVARSFVFGLTVRSGDRERQLGAVVGLGVPGAALHATQPGETEEDLVVPPVAALLR